MKKLAFIAAVCCLHFNLNAASWYVATTGNDNNVGTVNSPFKTLPTAIEAANPGDQIILRGGTYTSNEIRINKNNLHIQSYPGEWAVISAITTVEDISACLWYNEPETVGGTLERLEITGGYYYGIKFETNWDWDNSVPFNQRRGVSNVVVKDCVIHHSGRDAIKLTPACSNISIIRCEIHHTGVGPGALLDFNAEGIDNVNAPFLTVKSCYMHDIATTGIYVKGGGKNCVIEGNKIENCGEGGIYLGFYTDADWFDTDANPTYFENIDGLVMNNLIINTQHAGIGLWGAKNAQVYNNTVINGGQAEHAALFFNITDVWIDENNTARTGSENVRVQNNIFVQNAQQNLAMVRVREGSLMGNNVVDNNIYYDPNGAVFQDDNLDWQEWTLAQWKAATSRDLHSFDTNPMLDNTYHLLAGSPCINTGVVLTLVNTDIDGHNRTDGATDIGADEFGSVSGISTPLAETSSLTIVGNPVQTQLVFTWDMNLKADTPVSIMDMSGKMWLWETPSVGSASASIPVGHLPAGVYVLSMGGMRKVFVKSH